MEKKERQFKVICLTVGGHSNKTFEYGETVLESQFLPGQADAYVKSKHVEEITDAIPAIVLEEEIVITPEDNGGIPPLQTELTKDNNGDTQPPAQEQVTLSPEEQAVKDCETKLAEAEKSGIKKDITAAKTALTKAKKKLEDKKGDA